MLNKLAVDKSSSKQQICRNMMTLCENTVFVYVVVMRLGWLTKNSVTIAMHFCLFNEYKCLRTYKVCFKWYKFICNFASTFKHYQGTDPGMN